jgi:hypothetical protein
MISHPWLSAYVEGCYQNFHSDVPHGPFSFVYSLTPWKNRTFSGGETLIAKPKLLSYFSSLGPNDSHEATDLIDSVPVPQDQLTVFDPRYPHGVREVRGVDSVLDSRLVIHGWFTEPRPMLEGSLTFRKIMKPMDGFAIPVMQEIASPGTYSGMLILRIEIAPSGNISKIEILSSNLLDQTGSPIQKSEIKRALLRTDVRFPKASRKSSLTLPLQITR